MEQVGVEEPYVLIGDDAMKNTFSATKRRIMDSIVVYFLLIDTYNLK